MRSKLPWTHNYWGSWQEMSEWKEVACFKDTIPFKKTKDEIVLHMPEQFSRFYNIRRRHKVVSINGNAVLITIYGNLVEEKKYPS